MPPPTGWFGSPLVQLSHSLTPPPIAWPPLSSYPLMLASLIPSWLLLKQTARRSSESNSPDVSGLCLWCLQGVPKMSEIRHLMSSDSDQASVVFFTVLIFFSLSIIDPKQSLDLFRLCPPPSLLGAYYLQPPDARAIFFHNDLLCNDTRSVTGGSITYWGGGGGHKRKRSQSFKQLLIAASASQAAIISLLIFFRLTDFCFVLPWLLRIDFFNDFGDFYCFAVKVCVRDVISTLRSFAWLSSLKKWFLNSLMEL